METFAYLQAAEEYENSESRELVCVENGLSLLPSASEFKVSGQMMAVLVGTACSTAAMGLAGAAQAFPLYRGDSGPDVSYVQSLLADAGYFSGGSTGYFGGVTESAVISFQSDSGLSADGVVGSATLNALERGLPQVNPGTLSFGSSGSEVTRLQNLLTDAGYSVPATGYFGSQTESAVISFQSARGLAADGIAGPATFAALEGFVPVNPEPGITLRFGDSGSAVTALQQQLIRRGFLAPGLDTGYFGASTEAALIAYQRSVGLVADGIYGPATANSFV